MLYFHIQYLYQNIFYIHYEIPDKQQDTSLGVDICNFQNSGQDILESCSKLCDLKYDTGLSHHHYTFIFELDLDLY